MAQDAAQGMYWNHLQATIHPFIVNSGEYKKVKVVKDEEDLELDGLPGFVTCAYEYE